MNFVEHGNVLYHVDVQNLSLLTLALFCCCCALVAGVVWLWLDRRKLRTELERTAQQCDVLKEQLEVVSRQLSEIEASSKPGSIFQKAVAALVGLGVPGLVLLAVMATSSFAGAAAITSSLALLGGPAGMIGGVAALVAIGLASKAMAEFGYPKVAEPVVRGLVSKGDHKRASAESLMEFLVGSFLRKLAIRRLQQSKV